MRRYWFEFTDPPAYSPFNLGCGVTAIDRADALRILHHRVFPFVGRPMQLRSVIEDVDMSTLDAGQVLPNMGVVTNRGVWFPLFYP